LSKMQAIPVSQKRDRGQCEVRNEGEGKRSRTSFRTSTAGFLVPLFLIALNSTVLTTTAGFWRRSSSSSHRDEFAAGRRVVRRERWRGRDHGSWQ
jgi:hypothetical protein